jgi:hypothetical protein
MQLMPSQMVPPSTHGVSRQHGLPSVPQASHVPSTHVPSKQEASPQHEPPSIPQEAQGIAIVGSHESHGGIVPGSFMQIPSMHRSTPLQKSPSSHGASTGVRWQAFETQWTSRQGSSSAQFASEKHSRLAARTHRSPTQLKPSGQTPSGQAYQPSRSSGVQALKARTAIKLEARAREDMRPDRTRGA